MTESKFAEIKDFLVVNISPDLSTREVTESFWLLGKFLKDGELDRAPHERVETVWGPQ